jgi:hypothetical protein
MEPETQPEPQQPPQPQEPEVQQTPEINTPPQENPKKSTKKKLLLILVVIFVLLLVGVAAYAFMSQDDTNNASETATETPSSNEVSVSTPSYLIQDGKKLSTVGDDNKLADFATLEENQQVLSTYVESNVPKVLYANQSQPDENGYSAHLATYGVLDQNGKSDEKPFPENTSRFYGPLVSPDNKKMIVEISDESGFMKSLALIDIATGETETVFTAQPLDGTSAKQNESFRVPIGWLDNSTALYQQQSCRQCDGPSVATLYELDTTSKTMEVVFDAETQNITELVSGFANFIQTPDLSRLFVYGGEYSLAEPVPNNTNYLYEINFSEGTAEFKADLKGDSLRYAGVSASGEKMYFGVGDSVVVDDNFTEFTAQELYELDVASGESQKIDIETRFLEDNNSSITRVFAEENGLYMVTNSYSFNNDTSESVQEYGVVYIDRSTETLNIITIDEATFTNDDEVVYNVFSFDK